MGWTNRGRWEAGACHRRRPAAAITATLGAVVLMVSIVACGNGVNTGHVGPAPAHPSPAAPPGPSSAASVGGDNVPPPSAPIPGPSSPDNNNLQGPASLSPTPSSSPTPSVTTPVVTGPSVGPSPGTP